MIQRVQTLFLAGVAISMFMVLFFPIWQKFNADGSRHVLLTAMSMTEYDKAVEVGEPAPVRESGFPIAIAILSVAAAITASYSIFQYGNRLTQIKLGALNSLFMAATLGIIVYSQTVGSDWIPEVEGGDFQLGFFLPMIGLVLNIMANRFIKRDEDLVRSADRLR